MKYKLVKKNIKFDKNKMYTVIVYNKPKGEIVSKKILKADELSMIHLKKNINTFKCWKT